MSKLLSTVQALATEIKSIKERMKPIGEPILVSYCVPFFFEK